MCRMQNDPLETKRPRMTKWALNRAAAKRRTCRNLLPTLVRTTDAAYAIAEIYGEAFRSSFFPARKVSSKFPSTAGIIPAFHRVNYGRKI